MIHRLLNIFFNFDSDFSSFLFLERFRCVLPKIQLGQSSNAQDLEVLFLAQKREIGEGVYIFIHLFLSTLFE